MTTDLIPQLVQLVALQELDLQLYQISEKLELIPQRRAMVETEVNAIRVELDALGTRKHAQEAEKRDLEAQVADAQAHLSAFESKLSAIKTNKEYQAALKEIAEGRRANKDRDDRTMKLMEEIDAAGQKMTQLSAALADKESQVASAVAEITSDLAQLETDRNRLTQERQAAVDHLAPEILRVYKTVSGRYTDALASVEAGICSGCRMKTPPQLYIELQRSSRLCQCPSCYRILFVPEKLTSPA